MMQQHVGNKAAPFQVEKQWRRDQATDYQVPVTILHAKTVAGCF
jgi:hypothetical protein